VVFQAVLTAHTPGCGGQGRQARCTAGLPTHGAETIGPCIKTRQSSLDHLHSTPPLLVKSAQRHLGGFLLDTIGAFDIPISIHRAHAFLHVKNALDQLMLEREQLLPVHLSHVKVHEVLSS
jgi:hypothetical protein